MSKKIDDKDKRSSKLDFRFADNDDIDDIEEFVCRALAMELEDGDFKFRNGAIPRISKEEVCLFFLFY